MTTFRYWDVFPKSIKQSVKYDGVLVPISVRGNPKGDLIVQSLDESIARIENNWIKTGDRPGATMILVTDSPTLESVRYIQVEVIQEPQSNGYQAGDNPYDWGL